MDIAGRIELLLNAAVRNRDDLQLCTILASDDVIEAIDTELPVHLLIGEGANSIVLVTPRYVYVSISKSVLVAGRGNRYPHVTQLTPSTKHHILRVTDCHP